mmetsp:Transcript_2873/g.6936  ORF Transcript_2873/g.6936 Transcript_2873/m.6936 type:complete len:83 (-) Transcript_2873:931-1179(-)
MPVAATARVAAAVLPEATTAATGPAAAAAAAASPPHCGSTAFNCPIVASQCHLHKSPSTPATSSFLELHLHLGLRLCLRLPV